MEDDELKAALKDVDVVFTGWGTHKLTGEIIEGADKLKLVAHVGGTVKPYVSEEVYQRGIKVASGHEIYADSVAEGCIAYLLCVLRKLPYYSGQLAEGIWAGDEERKNRGLIGRTVGLVGFGAISKKLIPLLKMFNTKGYVWLLYTSDVYKRHILCCRGRTAFPFWSVSAGTEQRRGSLSLCSLLRRARWTK